MSALQATNSKLNKHPGAMASQKKKKDKSNHTLAKAGSSKALSTSLDIYFAEINRFPLLSRDEEHRLALQYWKTGDARIAHKLVTSNLRFVVKIAMQYTKYGIKLKDLIQEGNLGLMMAVKRFDPNRGHRLISYAVWWIRAYMQKYILDSWSLVRMGTTQAQRKLFNSMKRIQRKLLAMQGEEPSDKQLAETLEVKEQEVRDMKARLQSRDVSLDTPVDGESGTSRLDLVVSGQEDIDAQLIRKSNLELVKKAVRKLRRHLNEKETRVLDNRLLANDPSTLQEVGNELSISRERVRQIEENVKKKLRETIQGMLAEGEVIDVE